MVDTASGKERTAIVQDVAAPEVSGSGRKDRIPLGRPRMKLNVKPREGYHRHWINDTPGRLEDAVNGGYSFVRNEIVGQGGDVSQVGGLDDRVSRVVGVAADGGPLRAYLMEMPQDMYEADQRAKMADIALTEDEIKRGVKGREVAGVEGENIYTPAGNVIDSKLHR